MSGRLIRSNHSTGRGWSVPLSALPRSRSWSLSSSSDDHSTPCLRRRCLARRLDRAAALALTSFALLVTENEGGGGEESENRVRAGVVPPQSTRLLPSGNVTTGGKAYFRRRDASLLTHGYGTVIAATSAITYGIHPPCQPASQRG